MKRLWRWLRGLTDDAVSDAYLARLRAEAPEEMPEAPRIKPPRRGESATKVYTRPMPRGRKG